MCINLPKGLSADLLGKVEVDGVACGTLAPVMRKSSNNNSYNS